MWGGATVADLILGPLLRYVDATSATIWVETSAPGTVEVACQDGPMASSRTFTAHQHHYALVVLEGLATGATYPYGLRLDGDQVWPEPDSRFPPSVIRTPDPGQPLRVAFGSCRSTAPHDRAHVLSHGVDILRAKAYELAAGSPEPPSLLLLLGDQVYADEPPPRMVEMIRERRSIDDEAGVEIADFEEYAQLYRLAWSEPAIRWLLSTVPTAMTFDDHDLRDDWNTSAAWQQRMRALPWWRRRVTAGLGAYGIYQHLGNLPPAVLAEDPLLAMLRGAAGDAGEALDEFAWAADHDPAAYRWSFTRDYGQVRLIVLDSRCARVLTPGHRAMLNPSEWEWFEKLATGDLDHLLIGSSLPVLLPQGVHQLERWNEAVCDGVWGARLTRAGEKLRQSADLEHWGAFRVSFDALAKTVAGVARGDRGKPPASVLFLSGDVHYSYLAKARLGRAAAPVYQIVCSPLRNPLKRLWRLANAVASFGIAGLVGRGLARAAGVRKPPFGWTVRRGPFFHNTLGTLELAGPEARLRFETASMTADDPPPLKQIAEQRLT
jgi:hypothetical protein